jgi:hypothetical protein
MSGILTERLYVKGFDFDPDSADATDVGWVDCTDYDNLLFQFFRTVGTGDVDGGDADAHADEHRGP